jgi:hypothetical protein
LPLGLFSLPSVHYPIRLFIYPSYMIGSSVHTSVCSSDNQAINQLLRPYVAMQFTPASPLTETEASQSQRPRDDRTTRKCRKMFVPHARFEPANPVLRRSLRTRALHLAILRRHFVSRFLLTYFSSLRLMSRPGPCCACDCPTVFFI